jgi:hypothetical protein
MLPISEPIAELPKYVSSWDEPNGLRDLFGERRGLEDRLIGSNGEDANAGEECARSMGGAFNELEVDWDLR